jgi:stress response protein YsnF
MATGSTSLGTSGSVGNEEVIPVAEEELRIGKRDVSHGRVRVRSYVVETPVSEQVSLREENVHIERRPADRAISGTSNSSRIAPSILRNAPRRPWSRRTRAFARSW